MDDVKIISVDNPKTLKKFNVFEAVKDYCIQGFSKKAFVKKWTEAPYDIRFRCTNRCNETCSRCFERSGPECKLDILSNADVKFYQDQVNGHVEQYVWTGGEWSLIYDIDNDYMLKMFENMDTSKSREFVIQTNCRWVFGKNRTKILSDLKQIQTLLAENGKQLKLDMSVDRYRSEKSLLGAQELIKTIVSDGGFKHTKLRILSCALDYGLTEEKVLKKDFFEKVGIDLNFEPRKIYQPYFQVCHANDTRIVIHEEYPTLRTGKASDNKFGYVMLEPELQSGGLAKNRLQMGLSIREDGNVKWHNYYDWDIIVPYKDEIGNNKPLEQIKIELINLAWKKRLKHNIVNLLIDLTPGVNFAVLLYKQKLLRKSYEENSKELPPIQLTPINEITR